jgi:hypothetical protein
LHLRLPLGEMPMAAAASGIPVTDSNPGHKPEALYFVFRGLAEKERTTGGDSGIL